MKIPSKGLDADTLTSQLEAAGGQDLPWRSGKALGYIYDAGPEIEAVAKKAFMRFMSENGLDPTSFPSLLKFETEVVAMSLAHLNAPQGAVGSFTSGGTESILLAVKSCRDRARALRPDLTSPEMILPVTAHAAFHKAAKYFDVKAVVVDVDPQSFKADPALVEAAITDQTIMLVGSAASYAHGVIDPIQALGAVAEKHDLWLHVDGCIGAFQLPYLARLGWDVPPFDFQVPGVSSISMDLHKYAYCPKGASVVLYRDKGLRHYQFFACARWSGYTVVNATMQSSKSGGPLAAAWAVLNFVGDEGFLEIARGLSEGTRQIVEGLKAIPGVKLLAEPEMSLVAFRVEGCSVFRLADAMAHKGWYVQPQLEVGQSPANLHLSLAPGNLPRIDALLADLRSCIDEVEGQADPDVSALVGALTSMPPEQLTPETLAGLLGLAGIGAGGELPDDRTEINAILNALPPDIKEPLLAAFFNELYTT